MDKLKVGKNPISGSCQYCNSDGITYHACWPAYE